jgi:hypothetical protein
VTYGTSIHRRPQPRDWDLFDPPNSPYYDQSPNLFRGLSRFLGSPHTLPDAITIACIGIWWYGKTRQGTFSQPYRRTNIDTIRDAQSDLQVMDKRFVLSLENLRAGRYYTLTSEFGWNLVLRASNCRPIRCSCIHNYLGWICGSWWTSRSILLG